MAQTRTAAKLVRFYPEELAAISERAHACGRTPARFIREAALGAIPKARRQEQRDRMLLELARIGGQLSVLATRSRATILPDVDRAQLAAALEQHRAVIRSLVEHGMVPTVRP